MSNEIVGGVDAFELLDGLLIRIVVLPPQHLEHPSRCDTEKCGLTWVRMCRGVEMDEGARVLVAVAGLDRWSMDDVERFLQYMSVPNLSAREFQALPYLWLRRSDWKPVAARSSVQIVNRVTVPSPNDIGVVEADGKANDKNSTHRIKHGQLGAVGSSPLEMHQGIRGCAMHESAGDGVAQLPGAVLGLCAQVTKMELGAIWTDGGDRPCP